MRRRALTLALVGTGIAVGCVAVARRVVRPWYERWGVEPADAARLLPGDELIAAPTGGDTRGIAIDAPAAAIWPWLVQMGFGRAGWYSYDTLDMRGRSADAIVPEWQAIAVGQTIPAWRGGGFEVVQIEPDRAIVLYLDDTIVERHQAEANATAVGGLGSDPLTPGLAASAAIMRSQPRRFRASWAFVLEPIDGGRTRLIERFRVEYPETEPWSQVMTRLFGVGVFVMTRRQLLGIKERAERLITRGPIGPGAEELPVTTDHQELVPA
jgi:hypothetical protein